MQPIFKTTNFPLAKRPRCAIHGVVHKPTVAMQGGLGWTAVIVDSHAIVRAGIRLLIAQLPKLLAIEEADDGLAAVTLIGRLRPDLVIMDMDLPSLQGIDVIDAIVRRPPHTRIIVLSSYLREPHAVLAMRAGTHGFVLKQSNPATLMAALHLVQMECRCFVYPQLNLIGILLSLESIAMDDKSDKTDRTSKKISMQRLNLVLRERQVLKLISEVHPIWKLPTNL